MNRIALTDGTGRWFDAEKAQKWDEETRWNGNNHISKATASQFEHETLYRTAGGIYVLQHWSQWQGSGESYDEISPKEAACWLSVNDYLDGDADKAGLDAEYAALELA